jgi:1-pyrroline-5-carboxylate dehydrogenase
VADFSLPQTRQLVEEALTKVRSEFGREYLLRAGGEWIATEDKLVSVNPANRAEIAGVHRRATQAQAERAIETAFMRLDAARILRSVSPEGGV